jgi:ATP-dependent DNA ligase
MTKQNKALDYNKLLEIQEGDKQLAKQLKFPLMAQKKFDGNYTVTEVRNGRITHYTSGGLNYTHTDNGSSCFEHAIDGYYIAERISGLGKLGARVKCNLRGPKANQTSTNHTYKVFDYLSIDDYEKGSTNKPYYTRYEELLLSNVYHEYIAGFTIIENKDQLNDYLKSVVKDGYEGLMLINPDWKWSDTKSRKIDFCKYKKRPTADLLCTGFIEGEGKYTGMIGSLILEDSSGREVRVGSGLNDNHRSNHPLMYINKVIEIEYEQIIGTYIQPSFIGIREDKSELEID